MNENTPDLELNYHYFFSSLGWLLLAATSKGICLLHFHGLTPPSDGHFRTFLSQTFPDIALILPQQNPLLNRAEEAILKYLGTGQPMLPLSLDIRCGTPFQRQVWNTLCGIPFGETRSYLQVAQAIGKPLSPRAVGQACGKNYLPILIPCHRVVASNGRLGGFSGGLHLKRALLGIEQATGFVH
jgi:O-6-methylguanine DNA methyltransferase